MNGPVVPSVTVILISAKPAFCEMKLIPQQYAPSKPRTEKIGAAKPGAPETTCGVARCGSPLQSTSVKVASRALGTCPAGKTEGGAHLTMRTASPLQARYGISASIGSG